ncbi:MAG: tetratricopeptide repeat protein, partial [FCB group bacterium]|nr:tetratricopeptide repeat protein [FCB group bacterium]
MSEKAAEHNYRMALMFYRTERYEDAIAILDDLALEFPDSKHVLYALAKCFAKVGRYQEARALCQELTDKHQDERAQT